MLTIIKKSLFFIFIVSSALSVSTAISVEDAAPASSHKTYESATLSPSLHITQQFLQLFFYDAIESKNTGTTIPALAEQALRLDLQALAAYFANASPTRLTLISDLPFTEELRDGFSVICYWPTKYCSVGCRHCNYTSPQKNNALPQDILSHAILQPEGVNKSIRFLKDAGVKRLAIIGGGEPAEALDSVTILLREAAVEQIDFATSGVFATTKIQTRRILDLFREALERRSDYGNPPVKFNIRVSIDMFHQEKIPIQTLVNLFEVMQEPPYKNMGFFLRSIDIINDNTVAMFADAINGQVTPMENYVRHIELPSGATIPVLYKNLIFDGRLAGKQNELHRQGFNFSGVDQFLERPGLCADNGKLITARTDSQLEASMPGGLSGLILYNGDIFILEGTAPDNVANIYHDSFEDVQQKSFRDIITRALLTYGVDHVLKISYEVEPELRTKVEDTNHWFHIIEKVLNSPEMILYTTIRLIQNYRQDNKLDETKLSPLARQLSELPQNMLVTAYQQSNKNLYDGLRFINSPLSPLHHINDSLLSSNTALTIHQSI